MRLLHECRYWKDSVFITFTYDEDHVTRYPCGKCYIDTSHLKNFWKSLREDKQLKGVKFKYYAVAEFGDKFGRCHFHAIVFGLSPKQLNIFQKHWPYGFVYVGTVTSYSCDYVSGYVQKKLTGKELELPPDAVCQYVPKLPRAMASGGLGLRYAQEHEQQFIEYGITKNGCRVGVPRYYRQKLPKLDNTLLLRADKFAMSEKAEDEMKYVYNISPEALEHKWQRFCESRQRVSRKKGKL